MTPRDEEGIGQKREREVVIVFVVVVTGGGGVQPTRHILAR